MSEVSCSKYSAVQNAFIGISEHVKKLSPDEYAYVLLEMAANYFAGFLVIGDNSDQEAFTKNLVSGFSKDLLIRTREILEINIKENRENGVIQMAKAMSQNGLIEKGSIVTPKDIMGTHGRKN